MLEILIFTVLIILIYWKLVKPYSTWVKRGIKQTNPIYLLGDNADSILGKESFFDSLKTLYNKFPEERYFGMYQMMVPSLMIRDPELIKTLTIKDFDHFVNRRQFLPDGVEPMWSKNLVSMKDMEWKQMRSSLTPSFTLNKLKGIFNLITETCQMYIDYYKIHKDIKEVELKNLSTRYTNDVIASVAFGIKCDSLNNPHNDFFKAAMNVTNLKTWRLLAIFGYTAFPSLFKFLNVPFLPRKATNFLRNVIQETIKTREEQNIIRPDMIQLLMETKKENSLRQDKFTFTDEDIAAQAFIFHLGGFETVAATIIFLGHSLVTHPNALTKLQREIDETEKDCNGKFTYEALLKMKYLDMVICETLRMWPSLPSLNRVCTKPYTMPPSNNKGQPIHIYRGEPIVIPVMALHYDPQYFPNPNEWDPERFNEENKEKINPYAYLPFGSGPRNCIGSRLALLEIKIFYYYFLLNFEFVKSQKTEATLKLSKRTFNMSTDNDVWIGIQPRNK